MLSVASLVLLVAMLALSASASSSPRLSSLASSDEAMSEAARQQHTHTFMKGLAQYGQHLAESAETIFLQASSIARHRDAIRAHMASQAQANARAAGEIDAGADESSQSEGEVESEAEQQARATSPLSPGLQLQLESAFASGDSLGVVTVLQQAHGIRLNTVQAQALAEKVEETMAQTMKELKEGGASASIDRDELALHLDSLIQHVETLSLPPGILVAPPRIEPMSQAEFDSLGSSNPPAWIGNDLDKSNVEYDLKTGSLYSYAKYSSAEREIDDLLAHPEKLKLEMLVKQAFSRSSTDPDKVAELTESHKADWAALVQRQKDSCIATRRQHLKCDLSDFVNGIAKGLDALIAKARADWDFKEAEAKKEEPLDASPALSITRAPTSTPEAVRDVEASIRNGVDPWYDLPGRSQKDLRVKAKVVADLLDPLAERCPDKCSGHGQCVMDLNSSMKSPSGATNVHPFLCVCDHGYVGDACQVKLDMHLRWLLTEGAAPFPKCCSVCKSQREAPEMFDDIPAYNNPFTAFAPKCQPFPRISLYSREDGSHEMIKGRRPDPSCSAPLGEITRVDPIVALELAADLGSAQQVLSSSLLDQMAHLSQSIEHVAALSDAETAAHVARLHRAGETLSQASRTALKASRALAQKLHLSGALDQIKASSVDLSQLIADYQEMPNDMEECCLYCQLEKDPEGFVGSQDPAANAGPNAILNADPREDDALQSIHRRFAKKREDRRHARMLGVAPEVEQDCCVVCPYNFRELERLDEAAAIRAKSNYADEEEAHKVFLEVFAEVEGDRRRRHQPMPCCAACPSQFLIAHAFPRGPWSKVRTLASQGL